MNRQSNQGLSVLAFCTFCVSTAGVGSTDGGWQSLRQEALRAYSKGDYSTSISNLSNALTELEHQSKAPASAQIQLFSDLANVYQSAGNNKLAESYYKKALEGKSEETASIRAQYANLLHKMNRENEAMSLESQNRQTEHTNSIGVCWMEADGTIKLDLRASGPGLHGRGLLSYPPNDDQYNEILSHIGPLKPGERKPVAPWPDKP